MKSQLGMYHADIFLLVHNEANNCPLGNYIYSIVTKITNMTYRSSKYIVPPRDYRKNIWLKFFLKAYFFKKKMVDNEKIPNKIVLSNDGVTSKIIKL